MPFKLKVNPEIVLTLTAEEIRDRLLALPDNDRRLVVTNPGSGDYRIISMERKADGRMQIKYSDVPEV